MDNRACTAYKRITNSEFLQLSELARGIFGITLQNSNKDRIETRIFRILDHLQLNSFSELYSKLLHDLSSSTLLSLIDELTINYTYFYRENHHFDFLKKIVSSLAPVSFNRKKPELRIWSAGCSSGEEPYTLAMVLDDYNRSALYGYDTKILGTDISVSSLALAEKGVYKKSQAVKLPEHLKEHYCTKCAAGEFEIDENIKKMVTFRRLNLFGNKFPFKKKFHVIFCRNVMIYFDQKSREELIEKFTGCLEDGGYLITGHSESLQLKKGKLKYIAPSIYRKE